MCVAATFVPGRGDRDQLQERTKRVQHMQAESDGAVDAADRLTDANPVCGCEEVRLDYFKHQHITVCARSGVAALVEA